MTSPRPIFARAKSLDGITARELESFERTTDDGGEPPVSGGLAEPAVVTLPLVHGDETVLLAQPAAVTDYWPNTYAKYDASAQTEVRAVVNVIEPGAVGAELVGLYSTSADDPDTFTAPALGAVTVPISSPGWYAGGWYPLIDAARADVAWAMRAQGGDGAATPVIGSAHLQFCAAPSVLYQRLYWRTGAPSEAPGSFTPTNGALGPFGGCFPPLEQHPWLTPTPEDVAANPGRLLKTKGNAAVSLNSTSTDGHWDVTGPILRFVSPPLAAQALATFPWRIGFSGSAPGGNTAGYASGRLYVWRPSTDEIAAYGPGMDAGALWFRALPGRAHVKGAYFQAMDAPLFGDPIPDFATEDGDRVILDVGGGLATGCGGLQTTEGYGVDVSYNGEYDGFADFEFEGGGGTASYIDVPSSVRFLSDEA
jgi:hypothetical protein